MRLRGKSSAESAIQFIKLFSIPSISHIIFSTKDRKPSLGLDMRPRMHAYLATVCRDLGAEVVRVGGVADHVHIVTTLPRTISRAQLIGADKENVLKIIAERSSASPR
jgi:REP element-mobilizing transposase RayT